MIVITFVFCCIAWIEWRYLRQNHRKPRTFRFVLFSILFMYTLFGALYLFRNHFTLATVIEAIFYPLEKTILWSDKP